MQGPPATHVAPILILVTATVIAIGGGLAAAQMIAEPDFSQQPFQRGMSFTTWGAASFNASSARAEILKMKDVGVEWVAVNVWWQQDSLTATEIHDHPGWTDTDANLTSCFQFIRSQGMYVLFKPMLDSADGYWRSNINASPAWLQEYEQFIVHAAKIAAAGNVDIFSMGCEMGSWQVHVPEVRQAIAKVKAVYSGALTYSANHDNFWSVEWWDEMDYVGISFYPPFTIDYHPTLEELVGVWDGFYDNFYSVARRLNKPILFTEVGAQSRDGTNMVPNDNKFSTTPDPEELALFYQALFKSRIWSASWFKGAYWWMWGIGDPNPITDNGFTPNLPLVKATLELAYKGERVEVHPNYLPVAIALIAALVSVPATGIFWAMKKVPTEKAPNRGHPTGQCQSQPLRQYTLIAGCLFGALIAWAAYVYNPSAFQVIYSAYSFSQFLGLSPTSIYLGIGATTLACVTLGALLSKLATRTRRNEHPVASILPWVAACLSCMGFTWLWGSDTHHFSASFVFTMLSLTAWAASAGAFLVLGAPAEIKNRLPRTVLHITLVAGVVLAGVALSGVIAGQIPAFVIIGVGAVCAPFVLRYLHQVGQNSAASAEGVNFTLEQVGFPPYPAKYNRSTPRLLARLKPTPERLASIYLLITAFALFAGFSTHLSPLMLVNFHVDLLKEFYARYGFALIFGCILGLAIFEKIENRLTGMEGGGKPSPGPALVMGLLAGFSGAICIGLAQLFPSAGREIILLAGGISLCFCFAGFLLNQLRLTGSNEPVSRATRALVALAILFTIGFTASGLKIAFVYVLTFFDFANGQMVVRTDFTTELNWPIPDFIISLYALITMALLFVTSLGCYLTWRRSQKRGKKENETG